MLPSLPSSFLNLASRLPNQTTQACGWMTENPHPEEEEGRFGPCVQALPAPVGPGSRAVLAGSVALASSYPQQITGSAESSKEGGVTRQEQAWFVVSKSIFVRVGLLEGSGGGRTCTMPAPNASLPQLRQPGAIAIVGKRYKIRIAFVSLKLSRMP